MCLFACDRDKKRLELSECETDFSKNIFSYSEKKRLKCPYM